MAAFFDELAAVGRAVWTDLRRRGGSLVTADLLFKAIAFAVLFPAIGGLLRLFLTWSGRPLLADAEIAGFLLHPIGWATVVVIGGAVIAVAAIELAVLATIVLGGEVGPWRAIRFVLTQTGAIFTQCAIVVATLLVAALPFVTTGGIAYVLLLTEHDINYYLDARPPAFWLAATVGVVLMVGIAAVWLWLLTRWALALPLLLFEDLGPRDSLKQSTARMRGHRLAVVGAIAAWLLAIWLFAGAVTALLVFVARWTAPDAESPLWMVAFATGMTVALWVAANLAVSVFANATLGAALAQWYLRYGRTEAFHTPIAWREPAPAWGKLTPARLMLLAAVVAVAAALAGAAALNDIPVNETVRITAHRGASVHAPENTLAAFERAIADRADSIELDVQETRDGRVVVVHDSDLMKLGGPPTKVWEYDFDDIRQIDVGSHFDPAFADQRVPTLDEVLALAKGRIGVTIELKYYGHDQQLEQRVIDLVEQHDMADQVVVMSLKRDAVTKFKAMRPDWTVGLLVATKLGDLTRAEADFLAVNQSLAVPGLILNAGEKGIPIHVWTVNDPVTVSAMISRGVDTLITDDPAMARRVLAERQQMTLVERMLVDLAASVGATPPDGDDRP